LTNKKTFKNTNSNLINIIKSESANKFGVHILIIYNDKMSIYKYEEIEVTKIPQMTFHVATSTVIFNKLAYSPFLKMKGRDQYEKKKK
jgi:hypothetical protein